MHLETEWSHFYKNLKLAPSIDTDATLYNALCTSVQKHPDRIAVQYAFRRYTYSEFKLYVEKAACFLSSTGVKHGDKIIICAGGLPYVGIMIYACNLIGAVPSLFSADYKSMLFKEYANADDYNYIILADKQLLHYASVLSETSIKHILVSEPKDYIGKSGAFFARTNGFIKHLYYGPNYSVIPSTISIHSWSEVESVDCSSFDIKEMHSKVLPSDLAMTVLENNTLKKRMFTSYDSKAILEQANLTAFLYKDSTDEVNVEKYLSFFDFIYTASFTMGYNSILVHGHTVCLKSWGADTDNLRQLRYYKPNVIMAFPTSLNELADRESYFTRPMEYLRTIISYGFPLNGSEYNRHHAFFERYAPNAHYEKVYGVAETASVYIYNPPELENNRILGIPVPGVRIKIFDEAANELPVGQHGRICVSTPAMALASEEDSSSDLKRQLRDERTWVFTGTLGHIDENNYVYFDGSITRKFDINGQYFYPYLLENQILQVTGVKDCLVFVHSGDHRIIAAVVPEEKYFFDNDLLLDLKESIEVQTELVHHLEMRQSEIEFLASLPKTRRGENDYAAFEQEYEQRNESPLVDDILESL